MAQLQLGLRVKGPRHSLFPWDTPSSRSECYCEQLREGENGLLDLESTIGLFKLWVGGRALSSFAGSQVEYFGFAECRRTLATSKDSAALGRHHFVLSPAPEQKRLRVRVRIFPSTAIHKSHSCPRRFSFRQFISSKPYLLFTKPSASARQRAGSRIHHEIAAWVRPSLFPD